VECELAGSFGPTRQVLAPFVIDERVEAAERRVDDQNRALRR
jgi:hypothetical protein